MKPVMVVLALLALTACSGKELQNSGLLPLSETEVTQALKDALSRSIAYAAADASRVNGYFGNPQLKIELPTDADKLEKTLRKLGLGSQIDQAVAQMNRAAELAASSAKPIFVRAITNMTIDDAFDILEGGRDAATQYLIDETGDELYDEFRPVVIAALDNTSATRYYNEIISYYNGLPLVFNVDPDLADYVTERAIDGLFLLMAQEEARIRTVSAARSTRLLKRVFGSLD